MRGTHGTYVFAKGKLDTSDATDDGFPSSNNYVPGSTALYTSGDGSSATVENASWQSTGGTTYSGLALRDIYGADHRVVWYEYRVLTMDTRGMPSLQDSFTLNPGSSSTGGAFISKCWPSSGTSGIQPYDLPFTGTPVDLSPFVLSATISQDATRPVQGTMTLVMKDDVDLDQVFVFKNSTSVAPLDYLYDAIQPVQCHKAPDGGTLRVPLGLYMVTAPELGFGGPAGTRTLHCSDVTYTISRNQTTMPPGPAYFGGATYSTGIITTTPMPTMIVSAGNQYDPGTSGSTNTGPGSVYFQSQNNTGAPSYGFVYLIDAIRALLTNAPDDPALPGCGIPVSWLHPQFPHAPSTRPPNYATAEASQWDWTRAGGVVDAHGPVMDAVVPETNIQYQEGMTYLEIINDLLYSGGFDPLFATDNVSGPAGTLACTNASGAAVSGTPVLPQLLCRPWPKSLDYSVLRGSWVYDTTRKSIVIPGSADGWTMDNGCNVIGLTMEDASRATIYVWAANMNPASPISLPSLGRRIVNVIRRSNVPKDLVGSEKGFCRLIAQFELCKGASQYETLTFSSAVVPFHTSLDRIAVNIQQRFYAPGSNQNLPGVVGGLVGTTGSARIPITLNDIFIEQGWEIQIPTQAPGNLGFPGPGGTVTDLSPLVSKGGATMAHTLSRYTRTLPTATWFQQARISKWVTDFTDPALDSGATTNQPAP